MKLNNHNRKNVEEENEHNDEPATFLFYCVWTDRISTFWVYPNSDAIKMDSFFN